MAKPDARPGDWDCPRCGNLNFSSRSKCNGTMDGECCMLNKPSFEQYGVLLVKRRDIQKSGDWNCYRCGNINFKIRDECNKCCLSKAEATNDAAFRSEGGEDFEFRKEDVENFFGSISYL